MKISKFQYNFTFSDKKIRVIISNRCTIPRSKVRRSIAFFGSVSARSRRTFRKREAATEFSSARDIIFSHGCRCIIHNAFDTVSTIRGSIERMSCDLFRYFSIPLYVHTMLIIKKKYQKNFTIIIYHFSSDNKVFEISKKIDQKYSINHRDIYQYDKN